MKTLKQLISAVTLSILASTAVAQTVETTPNLITSGTTHTWTGVSTGSYSVACPPDGGACSGGPGALYDPATNTIYFSYGQSTAAQTFAINQALANSGSGIVVQGYNYSWDILNNNNYRTDQSGTDTIIARVITFGPTGNVRRNDSWTYNTRFDWTTFSGTVNYITPGPTSDFGNLRVEFTGSDSGFWGGYFGPQVRNVGLSLNYTVDQCSVNPQSSPACPGYKTYYNIGDDSYSIIPFPQGFTFPLYGRTFTHSIMFDNGVVSFYDPLTESARLGGQQFYSSPLSNNIGSQFHYSIIPLWTDLAPDSNTRYYTQTDSTSFFKYTWENIQQWGHSNRPNTFSLEIRPTGYLGIQYDQINIQGYPITAGVVGNALLGEWTQHFRSEGTAVVTGGISNWSLNITQPTDCSDPSLTNQYCPSGTTAYNNWQIFECSTKPWSFGGLCETLTPTVWFDYKCSESALYSIDCPGYAVAYLDAECKKDTLYSPSCPGYDIAYFDQQCSLDPLYNKDCPLYADAFYVQQCTLDPLYDKGCTGYEQAYALKFIVNPEPTTTITTVAVITTSDPVAQVAPLVADPVVNQMITATTTSASPSQPVAPVQLAPAPQPVATLEVSSEEKKEDAKTESITSTASSSNETKDQPKTTRQALAERRLAAARAKAVEDGKQLAGKMGEAASIEAQIQVQGVVLAAMGFVPGFDRYSQAILPDGIGYRPFEIYPGQRNIDTPAARGLLGRSDRIHQEMVDEQYK